MDSSQHRTSVISKLSWLLYCNSILFLAFFSFIAFHNRFAADDYFWMNLQRNHSITGCVRYFYHTASGRWSANFLLSILYYLEFRSAWVLAALNLFNVFLFFLVSAIWMRAIHKYLKLNISRNQSLLTGLAFALFFFFLTSGQGQIWFWTNSIPQYTWSIVAGMAATLFILKPQSRTFSFVFIALSSLFIGGASETFAFVFLIIATAGLFYAQGQVRKKILWTIFFLSIGLTLNLIAPGNAERATWLPEKSLLRGMEMTVKTIYHFFVDGWVNFLLSVFCFFPVFMLIGSELVLPVFHSRKFLVRLFLITGSMVIISLFLPSYFLSDVAPIRARALAYFLAAAFVFACGIIVGNNTRFDERKIRYLKIFSLISIPLLIIGNAIIQFPTVKKYSTACDERIEYLQNIKDTFHKKALELKTLPPSGMLHTSEISSDTSYWTNRHLESGLQLDFNVFIPSAD